MKIAINGKNGRMGKLIDQCIADRGQDMVCNLTEQPDIIVDFSSPLSTLSLLSFAVEHDIPLVIGTTGLSSVQQIQIVNASEKIAIVQSPNMSIGANICFKAVEKMSAHFMQYGIAFEIGVTEIHHSEKKDNVSGTALRLGEIVTSSGYPGPVKYASLRLGDIVGEHEVIFAFPGEQVRIRHHTDSRINFAVGALKAAEWLLSSKKPPGLYDMEQVLGLDLM